MNDAIIDSRMLPDSVALSGTEEPWPEMPSAESVAKTLTFRMPKQRWIQCDFEFFEAVERRPAVKWQTLRRSLTR